MKHPERFSENSGVTLSVSKKLPAEAIFRRESNSITHFRDGISQSLFDRDSAVIESLI